MLGETSDLDTDRKVKKMYSQSYRMIWFYQILLLAIEL